MADKIENNSLQEGYTEFGSNTGATTGYFIPSGPLGRFFAKFFATKAQKEIVKEIEKGGPTPIQGDTVINTDVIKPPKEDIPATGSVVRNPVLPQLEMNRKKRYKEYEEMDEYPEIGAAFDIYADDSTQRGLRGERWAVKSKNDMAVEEIEELFETIQLDRYLWDIIRNTVKYGDCFTELILDINKPQEGLKKIKILNPNFILRVENEYGYLKQFLQEIPNMDTFNYGAASETSKPVKYVELDKNQIVHFRLHTSDPIFYPYGKSIAALCHRIFRSLKMMEDAMMIYRLSRAPERRIFYIDTGNLPTSKAEMFIERIKAKFKKEKYYNSTQGTVDSRHNPLSMDEDFFVPTKNGRGTKIDTLPGAQNLGEIEDVRYYRDKLLAALKIPKDYVVEKDKSPERKANLSQLDAKFARTILRVQTNIESGLENIAKRHLQLKGYPASVIKELRIRLPEPSDISSKRKLEIDEQKTRVIQAVQGLGLLSKKQIYREYFEMTDEEVERMLEEIEQEKEKEMEKEQERVAAGLTPEPGQGGAAPQQPQQPAPTAESKVNYLDFLKNRIDEGHNLEVLERIITKQSQKPKKLL